MTKENELQELTSRLASGDESLTAIETCIAYALKLAPTIAGTALDELLAMKAVIDIAEDVEEFVINPKDVNWSAVAGDEGARLVDALEKLRGRYDNQN